MVGVRSSTATVPLDTFCESLYLAKWDRSNCARRRRRLWRALHVCPPKLWRGRAPAGIAAPAFCSPVENGLRPSRHALSAHAPPSNVFCFPTERLRTMDHEDNVAGGDEALPAITVVTAEG